jgi:hypothetical protein
VRNNPKTLEAILKIPHKTLMKRTSEQFNVLLRALWRCTLDPFDIFRKFRALTYQGFPLLLLPHGFRTSYGVKKSW